MGNAPENIFMVFNYLVFLTELLAFVSFMSYNFYEGAGQKVHNKSTNTVSVPEIAHPEIFTLTLIHKYEQFT